MSEKKDYYQLLGLSREASEAEIKKAFKRAAMKCHPDRLTGKSAEEKKEGERKFKEISEAYEVLSDAEKRQAYDQFGHAGLEGMGGGSHGQGHGASSFGDIFEDIFGDIFGRSRGGHGQQGGASRGADLRYHLELSLEEAVSGLSKQIIIPTLVSCKSCKGSGAHKGSSPVNCRTCQGVGQIRMQQDFFSVMQTCPTCHGQGRIIDNPCRVCQGQGRSQDRKTLSVKIPGGVDTGDRIRLSGEGEAGAGGGPQGDLYVQIEVREHEIFAREGDTLYCEVPISFAIAAVGGELEVPTLDGRVKLKIPAETQTGAAFRLRGKGVTSVRSHRKGDLICRVLIETPVKLHAEQKKILRRFEESLAENGGRHRPKANHWFKGVKKFFEDMKST